MRVALNKRLDRLRVQTYENFGWCMITQTHRNGSSEIVGQITLDDTQEIRDLVYLLDTIVKNREAKK